MSTVIRSRAGWLERGGAVFECRRQGADVQLRSSSSSSNPLVWDIELWKDKIPHLRRKKQREPRHFLKEKPPSEPNKNSNKGFDDFTSEDDTSYSLQDSNGNSDFFLKVKRLMIYLYMETLELHSGPSIPLSPNLLPLNVDTVAMKSH
ncbi:hypothetical protein J6590_037462 [Homalodisca vitripennis]|nr:hypothetical protein J6590_037462 [Homalodisca vitripennis]